MPFLIELGGSAGADGSADSGATERISNASKSDPDLLRSPIERKTETRKDFPEKLGSKSVPSHLKFSKEQMKRISVFDSMNRLFIPLISYSGHWTRTRFPFHEQRGS